MHIDGIGRAVVPTVRAPVTMRLDRVLSLVPSSEQGEGVCGSTPRQKSTACDVRLPSICVQLLPLPGGRGDGTTLEDEDDGRQGVKRGPRVQSAWLERVKGVCCRRHAVPHGAAATIGTKREGRWWSITYPVGTDKGPVLAQSHGRRNTACDDDVRSREL